MTVLPLFLRPGAAAAGDSRVFYLNRPLLQLPAAELYWIEVAPPPAHSWAVGIPSLADSEQSLGKIPILLLRRPALSSHRNWRPATRNLVQNGTFNVEKSTPRSEKGELKKVAPTVLLVSSQERLFLSSVSLCALGDSRWPKSSGARTCSEKERCMGPMWSPMLPYCIQERS